MEQSTPIEYQSPLATNGSTIMLNMSAHSHHSYHTYSYHSNSDSILTITKAELDQLHKFVDHLQHIFDKYNANHYLFGNSHDGANSAVSPSHYRNRLGVSSKTKKQAVDELRFCYREVPEIFFRPDFSLATQDVFNFVISNALANQNVIGKNGKDIGIVVDANGIGNFSSNQQRITDFNQEKLGRYLDLVEIALLRQIWSRSPQFFRALDDIKSLQFDVSQTTAHLKSIRKNLNQVDEETVNKIVLIPKKYVQQKNENILHDRLICIQQVLHARMAILALLEVEDYLAALELTSTARKLYHEHLSQLLCMKAVGNQLDDFDKLICEVMCNKFVSLAIQWEDSGMYDFSTSNNANGTSDNDSMKKVENSLEEFNPINSSLELSNTAEQSGKSNSDEDSLSQLLESLLVTERIQSALNMYKNRVLESIRLVVRTCVMEYLTYFDPSVAYDDMSSTSNTINDNDLDTPFAQRVREMSNDNFLSCLSMCYEHVTLALMKASTFHKFLDSQMQEDHRKLSQEEINGLSVEQLGLEIDSPNISSDNLAGLSTSNGSSKQQKGNMKFKEDKGVILRKNMIILSKNSLAAAADLAQRSITQLINLRKEANSKTPLQKMKVMWECSLRFVLLVEDISGSTAYIVRQCLLSQTKMFFDYMHESCKGKLVNALDNERWVQCDVTPERQTDISKLVSGQAFIPSSKVLSTNSNGTSHSTSDSNVFSSPQPSTAGGAMSSGKRTKDSKPVHISGTDYKVVWSVLLLVETVLNYLDVAFNFQPVTADAIGKIVELLRLFDGRTKQLVLGAQAIQSSARLKSISAKHLAITGQSIGLVVALLPHIRAALLAQIPPKHHILLTEMDRISNELIEHHGLIVSKFVSIVGDFVDASSIKLKQIDWDRFQGQCEYFEEVQRNIIALHRVLLTILPPEQIMDVFSRIFALLCRKIPSHFDEVMPNTQTGKQRILDEVTHLITSFSRLKQIDCTQLTNSLEESFRKKYTKGPLNNEL